MDHTYDEIKNKVTDKIGRFIVVDVGVRDHYFTLMRELKNGLYRPLAAECTRNNARMMAEALYDSKASTPTTLLTESETPTTGRFDSHENPLSIIGHINID